MILRQIVKKVFTGILDISLLLKMFNLENLKLDSICNISCKDYGMGLWQFGINVFTGIVAYTLFLKIFNLGILKLDKFGNISTIDLAWACGRLEKKFLLEL